ncbi:MAG TPA: PEP-CTERM sorting domain-containing protein [Candidatus Omnitrophota bacterium]|nr:PEP-CTERM sorting domain-containing protein [Candidatus Omnitrophota bacterium]
MKKVLVTLAIVLFAAGSANAMPMILDPGSIAGLGVTGQTGVFDQLGIYVQTTSTDYVSGSFGDVGDLAVQSLIGAGPVVTRGLNTPDAATPWYLVGGWSNLSGYQGALPGTFVYTSGTLDLYVNNTGYAFGPTVAAGDGSGFTGTKVATLSLLYGTGALVPESSPDGFGGTVDLTWEFTWLQNGFWLDANGNPIILANLSQGERLFAIADANTDRVAFGAGDGQVVSRYIYSDHNGSVTIGVVPEPTSMVLFGTGLFGLAGAGLRKKILG